MSADDVLGRMSRDDRRYLIPAEVATILGCSEREVLAIPNSELPRTGIGRYVIMYKADVRAYLEKRDRDRDADAIEPNDMDLDW